MNIAPRIPVLFVLLLLLPACSHAQSPASTPANLPGKIPVKIIDYGGGWKNGQVNEPVILVNPRNPARLIMFYSAMQLGGSAGAIGKAWADVRQPLVWHEDSDNPILAPDPAITFEISGIRLDAVIYDRARDEYRIYYTGSNARIKADAIGLATCPVGRDGYSDVTPANIKRYAGNPILSPGGQGRDDETYVSQGAVFREKGMWHSLYSYRTAQQTLPGIRHATSRDGLRWTKTPGPDLLTAAPGAQYVEWHQVYKINGRYVMLYEAYNGGVRWGANVAVSDKLTGGWRKLPGVFADQTAWANYADETMFHVATPAIYRIGGHWYLYFQAARAGPYYKQPWALWGIVCDEALQRVLAVR
ncbi:MAG: hypothetical protein ACKV2V_10510 [Blastocatellia bacterium]